MKTPEVNASSPTPPTPTQQRQHALEVARKFETVFARQMVEKFRATSVIGEEGGMFGQGAGASTYASWFDDHMSEHLTSNGQLGIADNLMQYFERIKVFPTTAANPATTGVFDASA